MTASTHRFRLRSLPRWGIPALFIALVLVLAACAGGGAPIFDNVGSDLSGDSAQRDEEGNTQPGAQPGDSDTPPFADLADRQIVKTGEVTLEVSSVATAAGQVRAMALQLGGYVGGSQSGGPDDAATLTLRIPANRFDDAISRLHELDGEVVVEATREEDVTASVVDMEARIRNLQASEAQYRVLLEKATDIQDILTVQGRLDEVRGQIEQLQAQLDQLSGLANLATLTVTLVPAAAPIEEAASSWDAGAIFEGALAALVGVGQALATAAIWLGIVGLPLAFLAGVVLLVALRLAPSLRRRTVGEAEQQ